MTGLSRRALTALMGFALAATACTSASMSGGTPTPVNPGAGSASGGHSAGAASRPGTERASGGPNAVTIHLVAFGPSRLEVPAGATVTWTQTDKDAVHTVTSGTVDTDATGATTLHADGRFDSGQLTEGKQFSFAFSQPGTYPYFCVIHQATMRGEVSVR